MSSLEIGQKIGRRINITGVSRTIFLIENFVFLAGALNSSRTSTLPALRNILRQISRADCYICFKYCHTLPRMAFRFFELIFSRPTDRVFRLAIPRHAEPALVQVFVALYDALH